MQLSVCVRALRGIKMNERMERVISADSIIQVLGILQARNSNTATGGGYFMAPIYV